MTEKRLCIDCGEELAKARPYKLKTHKGRCKKCAMRNARTYNKFSNGEYYNTVHYCNECGIELNNDNKSKYNKRCHDCQSKIKRQSRQKLKLEILQRYGTVCACCGENKIEFLAVDHINGGGNKERKNLNIGAGTQFYLYLKRNNYPEGYRILCHNCNMALGFYGYCPHGNL